MRWRDGARIAKLPDLKPEAVSQGGHALTEDKRQTKTIRMCPEKVAYWYLRLNGFLQIENFYVHPPGRGGARTDADLLAVRFPHRTERLYDNKDDIMQDDSSGLGLSSDQIDVVIAEVTAGKCKLNGPWTNQDGKNIQRVLAAIGCLPADRIRFAAKDLYSSGLHKAEDRLQIRLIAIGLEADEELASKHPSVRQVLWADLLKFIFDRHKKYRHQKSQTDHWDKTGKNLKEWTSTYHRDSSVFVQNCLDAMGVKMKFR